MQWSGADFSLLWALARSPGLLRPAGSQCEINGLRFFGRYRDVLILGAVLLLPDFDGVIPRRHAFDREAAVLAGHREERMPHYADIRAHPRMDITLHRNHDFLFVEGL